MSSWAARVASSRSVEAPGDAISSRNNSRLRRDQRRRLRQRSGSVRPTMGQGLLRRRTSDGLSIVTAHQVSASAIAPRV